MINVRKQKFLVIYIKARLVYREKYLLKLNRDFLFYALNNLFLTNLLHYFDFVSKKFQSVYRVFSMFDWMQISLYRKHTLILRKI